MNDVVLMLQKKIPVGMPPYPFQFRHSLESSLLPPTIKVLPKVNAEVSPTNVERFGEANPSAFCLPVKTGGVLSYISKKLMGKFGSKKGSQSHETDRGGRNTSKSSSSPYKSLQAGPKNELFFFEGIMRFDFVDLLKGSAEELWRGDFRTKYKVDLNNGVIVCVDRLRKIQYEHKQEMFVQYLEVLGNLRHNKVVNLKAYYIHSDEEMLQVYDYTPCGSLFSLLHDKPGGVRPPQFDWYARLKIAAGVPRGLDYIHHYSLQSPRLSHGNIKSTNVLIEPTFNPQLIDFDMSAFATLPIRTRPNGYRAPETLIVGSNFSHQKADIYAFGVLLLEILIGMKPLMMDGGSESVDLPGWVQSAVREGWTSEVFDLELRNRYSGGIEEEELVMLLKIAMPCVSSVPDQRPSIDSVVMMIEGLGRLEKI